MFAIQVLPKSLKRHYTTTGTAEADTDAVHIHFDDGINTIEIDFKDGTTDVWQWTKSGNNPAFPNSWVLVEEGVPTDENETILEMESVR